MTNARGRPRGSLPSPDFIEVGESPPGPLPVVAIVGRPNVGKSSLFNRMARERTAVTADEPGTTRDRVAAFLTHDERPLVLVDTGGLVLEPEKGLAQAVREQVERGIAEADLLLFLVDVTFGVVPADEEVAALLRTSGKPILLVVNKVDSAARERLAVDFYRLALGDPIPISAHHNSGIEELWDRILARFPAPTEAAPPPIQTIAVAIVGRPNVGKSSLLNAILGEERVVVDEAPGTTRDAVDTPFTYQGRRYLLIDTAGLRRRGHIEPGVEQFSVARTLQAIQRADVAVLIMEASEAVTAQDLHVAGFVQEAVKGLVLVVNKWDLVDSQRVDRAEVEAAIRARLKFFPQMPVLFTSALQGTGVTDVLEAVDHVYGERVKRVSTAQLNRVLMGALAAHPPPSGGRRRLQIYYATQAEVNPPTFVFFANDPSLIHFSYRRYLENTLRRAFGFQGTAIRLTFRGRSGEGPARHPRRAAPAAEHLPGAVAP